jgi:chromosome segregation ATPase
MSAVESLRPETAIDAMLRELLARPDPTTAAENAVNKAVAAERDYVDGKIEVLEERLAGIDEATKLRLGGIIEIPHAIDEKVGNLKDVTFEKFASVATQFAERDTRSERESRDNKIAVDAAFAAQKEIAAKVDEANSKRIDKSEQATEKIIDALGDKIDDLKERLARVESSKQGATEQRQESRANISTSTAILGGIAAVFALLALLGGGYAFSKAGGTQQQPVVVLPAQTATTP